jgi:hypothetical protein
MRVGYPYVGDTFKLARTIMRASRGVRSEAAGEGLGPAPGCPRLSSSPWPSPQTSEHSSVLSLTLLYNA